MFTFTIGNVRQLGFQSTVHLKVLRSSADRHLYDSEFQIEGALTVNAFANNASVIFGTNNNNLSDDRNVRVGCPLTSTWPHLNSDVGPEEGEY